MCGAGGELRGGAGTTAAGPLGAKCGAAYGPQAAPHPPLGCCHPVPRLGWELKKLFRRGGGSGATSASAGCCLVPSWASPAGPPRPPALSPQTFGFWQQLGGAKTWGFGRGWRQGAGGSAGRRASPRTGTPPQGRSQPQGTHRKHWRGGWGHWARLRSWQRACVCAHTCERAARGPTGTSPRPPPAFLGAAVPASEGGAQPKPLGEPPPPPNQSALPWELKTCLFQDILLRMLYKCLRYAYNN